MPHFTDADVKKIIDFLAQLHVLTDLSSLGSKIISILPQVVDTEFTSWSPTSFPKRNISGSVVTKPFGELVPSGAEQLAQQRFYEHPYVKHYLETQDGSAYMLADFVSEAELHQLEGLYQFVLRSISMEEQMVTVLPIPNGEKSVEAGIRQDIVMSLHRPKRNFSERDRQVLNLLRPHLALAYCNARAVSRMRQELLRANNALEEVGIVRLNNLGKVQMLTRRAWELLSQYFPSSRKSGEIPETLQRWVNHELKKTTQVDTFDHPCLPLKVEIENKQLIIRLVYNSEQNSHLLLFEEPISSQVSAELFELTGLTQREAQVLFQIYKGKNSAEIAKILSITEGTVKKHVEHIYEKFNVTTRTASVVHALKRLGLVL